MNNKIGKLLTMILFGVSISLGNIGGVFYNKSIAGFSIDSAKSIISAETSINCEDSTCLFKTIYRVNSNSCRFTGKFYGVKFSDIRVNGKPLNNSSIKSDSLNPDSYLFKRKWVLQDYYKEMHLQSIPITVEVAEDSLFIIQGVLHPSKSENWGLAAYPDMVSLRHLWLNRPQIYNNEYNVAYIFAPVESFKGLKRISMNIIGKNTTLLKRKWHRPINTTDLLKLDSLERQYANRYSIDMDSTENISGSTDSISWGGVFPDAIEYFYKIDNVKENNHQFISPGGPLFLIGARSNKFHSEIGWEVSINPVRYLSLLPSATAAFNSKGYMDWSIGLRGYINGFSLGVNAREFKSAEITFGFDFYGLIGVEGRNNALLAKFSI